MRLADIADGNRTFELEEIQDKSLILEIQTNLKRLGYWVTVDGVIGKETLAAYARFKKDHWLSDPHLIGEASAELLLERPDVVRDLYRPTNGAGIVTSPFGMRGNPPRPHKGIDIGAPKGTSIYAIADGIVATLVSGCQEGNYRCGGGYGNVVYLMHRGLAFDQTRYAHLDRLAPGLAIGNEVKRGQLLGYMGNTGHSFGSHLHFEIRVNGVAKNPIYYINPIV